MISSAAAKLVVACLAAWGKMREMKARHWKILRIIHRVFGEINEKIVRRHSTYVLCASLKRMITANEVGPVGLILISASASLSLFFV